VKVDIVEPQVLTAKVNSGRSSGGDGSRTGCLLQLSANFFLRTLVIFSIPVFTASVLICGRLSFIRSAFERFVSLWFQPAFQRIALPALHLNGGAGNPALQAHLSVYSDLALPIYLQAAHAATPVNAQTIPG
jgi:hypothetical protein